MWQVSNVGYVHDFFHRSQTFDMWVCQKNGERPSYGNLKRKNDQPSNLGYLIFRQIHF